MTLRAISNLTSILRHARRSLLTSTSRNHQQQIPKMPATKFFFIADEEVEDMSMYKMGGYHPVTLGDTFSNIPNSRAPRYRVLHKLGHGSFSTVWIAQDLAHEKYVWILYLATLASFSMCYKGDPILGIFHLFEFLIYAYLPYSRTFLSFSLVSFPKPSISAVKVNNIYK